MLLSSVSGFILTLCRQWRFIDDDRFFLLVLIFCLAGLCVVNFFESAESSS